MRDIVSPLSGIRSPFGERRTAFSPAALFALAEPGVWYDPSDVANLDWRRNLLTFTEQFDNAAWTKTNLTVSANNSTAPDGLVTADLFAETTATGEHNAAVSTLSVTSGTSYTASFYAKYTNRQYIIFRSNIGATGAGNFANSAFDIQNGSVFSSGSGHTCSITSVGNGWYRCIVTMTPTWTGTTGVFAINMTTNGSTFSYTGDAANTVLIWGAQLEVGSTATTYQRITDVDTEVRALFPNATLYQDTAGTTPVTTPGQSVALALDKSKGLVLGSELVTNGTFDGNSTTGWVAGFGRVNGTFTASDGIATLTQGSSDVAPRYVTTLTGLVSGRSYDLRFTSVGQSGAGDKYVVWTNVGDGTGGSTINQGTLTAWSGQSRRFIVTATASTMYVAVGIVSGTTGSSVSIDNISVKELPGFHATQATAGSRPIYGIVPVGGRRNLLTFTEQFDNAVWTKNASSVSANSVVAPNGTTTADTITENTANDVHVAFQSVNLPATTSCTLSCYIKAGATNFAMVRVGGGGFATAPAVKATLTGGGSVSTIEGSVTASSITSVGDGWYRVAMTFTSLTATSYAPQVGPHNNGSTVVYTGDGARSVYAWGAQLEIGSSATNYQRVVSQYDVTEAGVSSLSYLAFDGVDDFLVTPTITPGVDEVQVFAGLRKLSDATAGIVAELSANTGSNAGSFYLAAPEASTAANRYSFLGRGSITAANGHRSLVDTGAAPDQAVLTAQGDISADNNLIRRNGVAFPAGTLDQGTGNYLAYPMYIGRRGGTTLPANMQLYSLIVRFGANLTADQITSTETWVNGKTRAY